MNSFIQSFRASQPGYEGSDEDLVLEYGDTYPPDQYDYPADFLADYQRLKQAQAVSSSSIGSEVSKGVSRGMLGLKSTAAGVGALAADVVGADKAKSYLLDSYKRTAEQTETEYGPSVAKIEDVNGLASGAQYVAGKAGELIPNLGEAAVFAAAGTMAAPGPGTEAGAFAGLFAKQAARSVLKKTIDKSLTPEIKKELEDYVAGKLKTALTKEAAKFVDDSAKILGGTVASAANFAALGAGGQYGALANTEGVTTEKAREGAVIAGIGSSLGAVIPANILKGLLPGLSEPAARSYIDLYAKKVPAEILSAAGGMGAMEFFNVLSEKHADPKKRDEDFTKEDWSRILNGMAVGVLASAPAVGIQALRGVEPKQKVETVKTVETSDTPAAPEPGVTPAEVVRQYPVAITAEQELVLRQMADRQVTGKVSDADVTYLTQIDEPTRAKYQMFLDEAKAKLTKEEKAAAPKLTPIEQAVAEMPPENKAAVEQVIGKPIESVTGLPEAFKGAAATDELYAKIFYAAKVGDTKVKGVKDPLIGEAKPLIDSGAIKSPEELKAWVQNGKPKPQESAPVKAKVEPAKEVKAAEVKAPLDAEDLAALQNEVADEPVAPKAKKAKAAVAEEPVVLPENAADTAWVAEVPEAISAWRVSKKGNEKESFFSDLDKATKENNDGVADNSKTKAVGAFEDPDGSIVVATLYKNKGAKVAMPGREKDFDTLVAKGYKPIGYAKLKNRERDFFRKYSKEQWAELQGKLDEKVEAAGRGVVQEVAQAIAKTEGLRQPREVKEINRALEAEDAQRIADAVDKEFGLPTPDSARDNVDDALRQNNAILARLREIAGTKSSNLIDGIFQTYERVAARAEKEKLTPEQFKEAVTKELTGLKADDKPRMSVPADPSRERGTPEMAAIATHVTERLQRAGISVSKIQSGLQPLYGSLAKSLGSFDRARQTIIWALSDLTSPTKTDLRVLFEEAGHALFDRESPEMRDPVLRSLGKLAEARPEELSAIRRDIESAYTEGPPPGHIMAEEVAMGYLSRKMAEEGFNPIQARGVVQAVMRLLKEVYLKTAMWFQRNFLGPEYASSKVAADYFTNRMESFLAGDQETLSFVDRLGGRKATFDEQVRWHEPAGGESKDLVQVYNPVTGQIDTNPVLLDSVEAALLNIRGDDTRFATPAPGAPTDPIVDPAIKLNRNAAINNEVIDVQNQASFLAGVTQEVFRLINGLKNRGKITEVLDSEAQARNVVGFKRNQRISEFTQDANSGPSWRDSSKLLNDEQTKVTNNLVKDQEALPKVEARREKEIKDLERQTDDYKDAGFMAKLTQKGFRNLVLEDIRNDMRVSKTLGAVGQIYQELSGKIGQPIDRETVGSLRRLYTGELLHGEALFDVLDQMANDPSIDFSRPASEIRQYIKTAAAGDPTLHRYNLMAGNSRDSRAMLATVIAYGKLHKKEIGSLEMRRMRSGEDRAALEQELRDLWKETREQLDQGIRQVAKSNGIKEVMKVEYRKALRRVAAVNRTAENLRKRIDINEKALPAYKKALDKIAGQISETTDTTFGDQMEVRLPKNREGGGTDWETATINLNSAAGPVTTSEQQLSMLNRLSTWTAEQERKAAAGDQFALGREYQDARRQLLELVDNRFYQHALRNTDHYVTELILSNSAKQIESLGTPTATIIGEKLRKFVSEAQVQRNQADREFGFKNSRLKQQLLGIVNRGRRGVNKASPEWFTKYVLNSAFGFMEKIQPTEGLPRETDVANAYQKLQSWLMRNPRIAEKIGDRLDTFMPALRELIDTRYQSGQFWMGKNIEAGLLVEDAKLGGKLRAPFAVGLMTFQRKFSESFANMVHSLKFSGWAVAREELAQVGDLLRAGDTAGADAVISKYVDHPVYGERVKKNFLFQLFNVPDESVFHTPALDESGITHIADPDIVSRAYQDAGGNLRQAFELMFDRMDGHGDKAKYVQDSLMSLVDQFEAANSALQKIEPRQASDVKTFTGLIPNAMIDARQFSHWPSEWFGYHEFDRNDNARMAERISGQIHFGRDTRILGNLHQTLKDETDFYKAKLKAILEEAESDVPSGKAKAIDAAAERLLDKDTSPEMAHFGTGKKRLEYLRKVTQRQPFVDQFLSQMAEFYNRKNQAEGSLRWGTRFAQELSHLMVNNPGSAISQMSTLFDIAAQWGASPTMLKATAGLIKIAAKDIAGSLAQGLGFQLRLGEGYEKRFAGLLADPEAARKFGDFTATLEGESANPGARLFRQAKDLQSFTINRAGPNAQFTPLRPGAPFFEFVQTANRALTITAWKISDGYVRKAVDYLRNHPGTEKITAEMLGLKGLEKDSFERWNESVNRYGLRIEEMAKGAKERIDRGENTALTDKDLSRLYSVALNEISLEANIATMPMAAFNNSLLRFITPLLGWSYRRTMQLIGKRLDAHDQKSLKSVSTALLGLAATGLGGLGISLVVDAYQQDIVGKKRNIRDLRVPQTADDFIAIQERIARSGTLGLFGDLVNAAVNVGTGQGDNRMLSVDQRVVALQSFQGLLNAVSSLINQDFDADYAHVVRPVIAALGGNGMLQYMQIANNALGLDNVESRVVKRINASNYLRVAGRDQGLNLRKTSGGYATPTSTTPWIARMEYAAYANDPADFRAAYRGAIAEAKRVGKPDPADYIKKSFETRHPVRYVFAQVPGERDYKRILSSMDETGQESVRDAVRLFNYYGTLLGLTPFEGSKKKDKQASPSGQAEARMRALSRASSIR